MRRVFQTYFPEFGGKRRQHAKSIRRRMFRLILDSLSARREA